MRNELWNITDLESLVASHIFVAVAILRTRKSASLRDWSTNHRLMPLIFRWPRWYGRTITLRDGMRLDRLAHKQCQTWPCFFFFCSYVQEFVAITTHPQHGIRSHRQLSMDWSQSLEIRGSGKPILLFLHNEMFFSRFCSLESPVFVELFVCRLTWH